MFEGNTETQPNLIHESTRHSNVQEARETTETRLGIDVAFPVKPIGRFRQQLILIRTAAFNNK